MENICVEDIRVKEILPTFMKNDSSNITLAEVLDEMNYQVMRRARMLSIWNKIDEMEEAELDELANYLDIKWYWYKSDIKKKRQIIKDSKKVHKKLGTVWAIEYVMSIYFDDAAVVEWYEYGGESKHFKIKTYNQEAIGEKAEEFMKILNVITRVGTVLDQIEVYSTSEMVDEYFTITPHLASIENNDIVY